jgi:sugar phosphate isomerase/epimerase
MSGRAPEIGLCWGSLQNANLLELIDAAARYDFPTLTIRPDMFTLMVEQGTSGARMRQHLRDAGVRCTLVDALASPLPHSREPSASDPGGLFASRSSTMEACLHIADELEAPVINVCHYYFIGDRVVSPEMIDAVGAICREAQKRGKRIVMEFAPQTGIKTIGDAEAITRGVGMTNCGILIDCWHLARSGGSAEDIQNLPSGYVGAFQLNDRRAPQPGVRYEEMTGRDLPGEGDLPLIDIVEAAFANNPALTAEVEVFSQHLRDMPLDAAAARVKAAVEKWRASWPEQGNDGSGPVAREPR